MCIRPGKESGELIEKPSGRAVLFWGEMGWEGSNTSHGAVRLTETKVEVKEVGSR